MLFKTFIINMEKDVERRKFMSHQLNKLGIDFSIQKGIDGKKYNFGNLYDDTLALKFNKASLTNTEKGCVLSHRLCVEHFLQSDSNYALILEDDVALPDNFKKIIEDQIYKRNNKETSWEYLSFNYTPVGWKGVRLWLFLTSEMFKKNNQWFFYLKLPIFIVKFFIISSLAVFEGIRDIFYKKLYTYGKPVLFYRPLYLAGCYLINRAGAKKLLSVSDTLVYTADRLPNIARIKKKLKFYAFSPLLVYQRQDKFQSNNTPETNYILFK